MQTDSLKIEGNKIYLTPMTLDDAEIFVKWRNSQFVQSRFLYRKPFTVEGQKAWIRDKVMTGEVAQFVVWDKADNVQIGSTYLVNIDKESKKCEYGVLIGEEAYAGGGRGTEAIGLVTQYAFDKLDMHKVYGRILADNPASLKACEKNGFVKEGTFVADIWIDGQPKDVCFFAKFNK